MDHPMPAPVDARALFRRAEFSQCLSAAEAELAAPGLCPGECVALHALRGDALRELALYGAAERAVLEALRGGPAVAAAHPLPYADALHAFARLAEALGRPTQARPLALRALRLREAHAGPESAAVARSFTLLGVIELAAGRAEDAEGHAHAALGLCEHAPAERAGALALLARLEAERCRYAEAARAASEAWARRCADGGADHPDTLAALSLLGSVAGYRCDHAFGRELVRAAGAGLARRFGERHPLSADARLRAAQFDALDDRAADAERDAREAAGVLADVLGPGHPHAVGASLTLAWVLRLLERFEEAEDLTRAAVARLAADPAHPHYPEALADLAGVLVAQERFAEAEPVARRAIRGLRAAHGRTHPRVASALIDLSWCRSGGRDPGRAAGPARAALRICEDALGPDHPETARALENLAGVLWQAGRREEAAGLFPRLTELSRRSWGDGHRITLETQGRFAELLVELGRLDEAEGLFRQVHASAQSDAPERAAGSALDLAEFLHRIGRLGEAEPLYRDALTRLARPGRALERPVIGAMQNLGRLYHAVGDLPAAELRLREALALRERFDGGNTDAFASAMTDLASVYLDGRQYNAAEALFEHALELRRNQFGDRHPDTARAQHGLGRVLHHLGRHTAAEPLLRAASDTLTASLGATDPEALAVLHTRGLLAQALGKPMEAERLLRRLIECQRERFGSDDPRVAQSLADRARAHAGLGDVNSAEALLSEALRILRGAYPADHPARVRAHYQLAALYRHAGEPRAALEQAGHVESALRSRAGTEDEPELGELLALRGELLAQAGDPAAGCAALQVALAARQADAGRHSPACLEVLSALARCQLLAGDDLLAEATQRHAASLARRHPGQPAADAALDQMALFLSLFGRPGEAEPIVRQRAQALHRAGGQRAERLPAVLLTLSEALRLDGRPDEALAAVRKSLDLLDADGRAPVVMDALAELATVQLRRGETREAERALRQWRLLDRGPRGTETPRRARVTLRLALLCAAHDREAEAMTLLEEANAALDRLLPDLVALPARRERLRLARLAADATRLTLTLIDRHFGDSERARRLAADLVLRRRDLWAAFDAGEPAADGSRAGSRLARLRRQVARRLLAGPGPEGAATHRRLLEGWAEEASRLALRRGQGPAELPDAVSTADALPAGVTLVTLVRWRPAPPPGEPAGPVRLSALILRPGEGESPGWADLGDGDESDVSARLGLCGDVRVVPDAAPRDAWWTLTPAADDAEAWDDFDQRAMRER